MTNDCNYGIGNHYRIFIVAYICALLGLLSYTTAKLGPHVAVTSYYRYWLRHWSVSEALAKKCIIPSSIDYITHTMSEQSNTAFYNKSPIPSHVSVSSVVYRNNCKQLHPIPKLAFGQRQSWC